jgi:hypothetical protein
MKEAFWLSVVQVIALSLGFGWFANAAVSLSNLFA